MLKGKVVGLRAIEREDLEQLKVWRNNENFRQFFREFRELNQENQNSWFSKISHSPNDFMFAIIDLKTNLIIGACGLLYVNWVIRSADFSFYIGQNEIYIDDKTGYSKDACDLLINYGFKTLNLNKIWMELYEVDTSKINFFTKNYNFKVDGILRDNCFLQGKYFNSKIISLLSTDYTE